MNRTAYHSIREGHAGGMETVKNNLRINDSGRMDMRENDKKRELLELIGSLKVELSSAAKAQPCPGCKHDMEQVNIFLDKKGQAIIKGKDIDDKTKKILYDISYMNEFSNLAISASRIINPFVKIAKKTRGLDFYAKIMEEDKEGNKVVEKHLLRSAKICKDISGLSDDKDFADLQIINDSFLKATQFKLNMDPTEFYVFDKFLRIGFKTHMLQLAGRVTVKLRGINNNG